MVSSRTKVMRQRIIDWRSPSTVPALSIEKHFWESGSISKNHFRGLFCEHLAAQHFSNLNYKLLAHRYRTPFGEIDLVFYSSDGSIKIVEVKSSRNEYFFSSRLKRSQKLRLARIHSYFLSQYPVVELEYVTVDDQNKVQVYEGIWS